MSLSGHWPFSNKTTEYDLHIFEWSVDAQKSVLKAYVRWHETQLNRLKCHNCAYAWRVKNVSNCFDSVLRFGRGALALWFAIYVYTTRTRRDLHGRIRLRFSTASRRIYVLRKYEVSERYLFLSCTRQARSPLSRKKKKKHNTTLWPNRLYIVRHP